MPEDQPVVVSAEDAAQDTHRQRMGDRTTFLLGKKRRARRQASQVAEAIRMLDEQGVEKKT